MEFYVPITVLRSLRRPFGAAGPTSDLRARTMSTTQIRKTVTGSERAALGGARAVGPAAADERFEVTVRVRRRAALTSHAARGFDTAALPANRHYLTRPEYAAAHGADPADLAKVEAFARAHGLVV